MLRKLQEHRYTVYINQENNTRTKWEIQQRDRKHKTEPNRNFGIEA